MRARMAVNARKDRIVRGIDMTVCTDRAMVRYLEPGMVESRAQPIRGDPSGVARHAGGRVLRGGVIRDRTTKGLRAYPRRLVAAVAIGVRRCQREVVVDVARSTRRGHVSPLQGPTRGAVIELAVRPEQCVVASRAL